MPAALACTGYPKHPAAGDSDRETHRRRCRPISLTASRPGASPLGVPPHSQVEWWGRCAHPSRRGGWSTPRDTTNEGRLKGVGLAFREPARGRQWNQCCQGKEFLASCSKTRTAAPSTAVDPEHVTQLGRGSSSIPVQHPQNGCNHLPYKYLLRSRLDLTEPACRHASLCVCT